MPYEERALSPVFGVILMVSIVVILTAVIAAFVFGMAGQYQSGRLNQTEIVHITCREIVDEGIVIRIPEEGVYGDFRYVTYADNGDVYLALDYSVFRNLTAGWHTVETVRKGNQPVVVIRVIK